MSTLTGIRYNPVLKEFYQRLRASGKLHHDTLRGDKHYFTTKENCIVSVFLPGSRQE
jgi:hypothetical protein